MSVSSSLEQALHLNILATVSDEKVRLTLAKSSLHLAVVDAESVAEELDFVQRLRHVGYDHAILLLTEHELNKGTNIENIRTKLHYLEKPYDDKTLIGIVKKLLKSHRISQQRERRFNTQQEIMLERFHTNEIVPSKMFNLSKSGAYCEFSRERQLIVGDLVRLNISLTEVSKAHKMNAKVVWTTRDGRYSGQNGAGLRFIRNEDVYLHLMNKA